ncbi:MAG: T9SS type A sorting domain-containing protein [Bacteroidetes bacterium]|nr:T9SS type A sorting domain-containing protein [Bacteroidota bacterium]
MIKINFNFTKLFSFLILMAFSGLVLAGNAPEKTSSGKKLSKNSAFSSFNFLDVNNILVYFENTGNIQDPGGNWSIEYPKGSGKHPIFAAGFAFSGYVDGELRTAWMASASRAEEWQPGNIENNGVPADPNNSRFRVYKYTKGDGPSSNDVLDWPTDLGAEYTDVNGNGTYEPELGELPKLYGDQMVWYVINDGMLPSASTRLTGSKPIGIEAQVTAFSFAQKNDLGNVFYVIYKFINKGSKKLENAIFSIYSDPDLGNATDDLVGVDSLRSLAYVYNETNNDNSYGSAPPAAGYDFFLGPKEFTGNIADTTWILGKPYAGYRQLVMKSFVKFINGRADLRDPNTNDEGRYYQEGLKFDGSPFNPLTDGVGGLATDNKIIVHPGYPESNLGWRDAIGDDRRMMINTKPFNIDPSDTQVIVVGYMVASGTDNKNSIAKLRNMDELAQKVFNENFKVAGTPPPPKNPIGRIDKSGAIHLTFKTYEPFKDVQRDSLGNKKVFKGFNIYQYNSGQFTETVDGVANKKLLLQIDRKDGYDNLYQLSADGLTSTQVFKSAAKFADDNDYNQPDSYFDFSLTSDAFTNFKFVEGQTYYFGLSSYNVEVNKLVPILKGGEVIAHRHPDEPITESGETKFSIVYKSSVSEPFVIGANDSSNYVKKNAGNGTGLLYVDVLDQSLVKDGAVYNVDFYYTSFDTLVWRVKNESAVIKLDSVSHFSTEMTNKPVDGLSIRIATPVHEIKKVEFARGNVVGTGPISEVPRRTKTGATIPTSTAIAKDGGFVKVIEGSTPVEYVHITSNAKPALVRDIQIEYNKQNPSKAYRYLSGVSHVTNKAIRPIWQPAAIVRGPSDSLVWAGYTVTNATDVQLTGRLRATRKPGVGIVDIPFIAYDNSYRKPNGDRRRLKISLIESFVTPVGSAINGFVNGRWDGVSEAKEILVVSSEEYNPNLAMPADTTKIDRYMNYFVKNDSLLGDAILIWEAVGDTLACQDGDTYTFKTTAFGPEDKYTISGFTNSNSYYENNKKSAFEELTIYPNPYMGDNPQETNANARFVSMLNVPKKATVRIYNLAGELVRKLDKDDNSALMTWDLKNHTGLYVASGLYLIHFDAPGIGSKVLKFALIQRQEQINVY